MKKPLHRMDEIDREIQYEEALGRLPVTEDTKWLMQYIRATNKSLYRAQNWLMGIFYVLVAILAVLLTVHWDTVWSVW